MFKTQAEAFAAYDAGWEKLRDMETDTYENCMLWASKVDTLYKTTIGEWDFQEAMRVNNAN